MKKKIVLIIAFVIIMTSQTMAQKISIIATKSLGRIGDVFVLNIEILNVYDLMGFQCDVDYDPNILEFLEASEGTFLNNNTQDETIWISPKLLPGLIDNLACARLGQIGGKSGKGFLAKVIFRAKNAGQSDVLLKNVLLADSNGEPIEPKHLKNIKLKVKN